MPRPYHGRRHLCPPLPYAVSFGPEHEDMVLPEFGGPMHGANEAAPIDKLLEALKIYIIALLRLEEIDF